VKETLLVYNFPESSLVPESLFTMDTNREIIDTLHGNLNKGLILTEKIPWWELFNVYRISSDLHQLLQQQFTAGTYWHYYSLLLKSYKMFDSTQTEDCIKVIFYADKMVALIIRNGKVHLMQTFFYQDTKDVAYHLLNCCQQLGISQQEVKLLVGGLIDRQSALSTELHKYFLKISFEEIDESIKVTDELKELPLHYFSSILKMAVCA
jgi:methyltransferase-like protein